MAAAKPDPAAVASTTLIVLAIGLVAAAAYWLANVLLLAFGAVIVATGLGTFANGIGRITGVPRGVAIAFSVLAITGLVTVVIGLLGAQVAAEIAALLDRLPQLLAEFGDRIGVSDLDRRLEEQAQEVMGRTNVLQSVLGFTPGIIGVLTNLVLAIVAGIYFAARPTAYRDGLLLLVPATLRDKVGTAVDNTGRALRLWLLGQLVAMLMVGTVTTLGLLALGMPSALALGLLAGLADFVPVVGPILAAIPALLLAFSQDSTMVLWVLALYILVQQIEGNLIIPLVQRRAVDLPPALTLFALLAFGVLFGPLGILLAAPLTVAIFVMVKQLYVRETLGETVNLPGEKDAPPNPSPQRSEERPA